jgi:hypothetical protein
MDEESKEELNKNGKRKCRNKRRNRISERRQEENKGRDK